LLFGQLVPRFDNRIISNVQCPERKCLLGTAGVFNFRWGMTLANIRVGNGDQELRPLTVRSEAPSTKPFASTAISLLGTEKRG